MAVSFCFSCIVTRRLQASWENENPAAELPPTRSRAVTLPAKELELTVTLTEAITEAKTVLTEKIVKRETNTGNVFGRATAN